MLPMQPGDMVETYADHRLLEALTGFRPRTNMAEGVTAFVEWYLHERPRNRDAVVAG
jgi:UDP-glucuronate 4-epimerase